MRKIAVFLSREVVIDGNDVAASVGWEFFDKACSWAGGHPAPIGLFCLFGNIFGRGPGESVIITVSAVKQAAVISVSGCCVTFVDSVPDGDDSDASCFGVDYWAGVTDRVLIDIEHDQVLRPGFSAIDRASEDGIDVARVRDAIFSEFGKGED